MGAAVRELPSPPVLAPPAEQAPLGDGSPTIVDGVANRGVQLMFCNSKFKGEYHRYACANILLSPAGTCPAEVFQRAPHLDGGWECRQVDTIAANP